MKRIIVFLTFLLLILNLCACGTTSATTPTTEATLPTETEPSVPYTSEELQENLGITIAADYTETAFELEVSWINNTGFNREFGHLFGITVLQNGTPLTLSTSTDTVTATVSPDASTTMILQYVLNDLSPVTVELRYSEPNTPGILWTCTYGLAAAD